MNNTSGVYDHMAASSMKPLTKSSEQPHPAGKAAIYVFLHKKELPETRQNLSKRPKETQSGWKAYLQQMSRIPTRLLGLICKSIGSSMISKARSQALNLNRSLIHPDHMFACQEQMALKVKVHCIQRHQKASRL